MSQLEKLEYKALVAFGKAIPNYCWFQKRFNLSWTPCALNPFFTHLVELSIWAKYPQDFISIILETNTEELTPHADYPNDEEFNSIEDFFRTPPPRGGNSPEE